MTSDKWPLPLKRHIDMTMREALKRRWGYDIDTRGDCDTPPLVEFMAEENVYRMRCPDCGETCDIPTEWVR